MTKARDLASGNPAPSTVSTTELGYLDGVTSAIQTQVDSKLATAQSGLIKIIPSSVAVGSGTGSASASGTVTFSGASSVSLNGVFTSTYKNYRIAFTAKNASAADLSFFLRAAGTNLTGSSYLQGRYFTGMQNSIASNNQGNITQGYWDVNQLGTVSGHFVMDIFNPQTAEVTTATTTCTGAYFQVLGQSVLTSNTTSYDGFSVSTGSTITGSVSVYGYN